MNLEFNKLFAALLVAGITAGTAAFVSDLTMHPHELEEDAVPIEGVEVVAGAISAPQGPEPVMHLIAAADVARGEKLSKACAACHSFDKGGPNRVGPNMWAVVGNTKASHADFAYSDALKGMDGQWGYAELNKFLYKPKQYVAGTKMNYIGIKKPEDRAAMIAWLRTLSDSPIAMPTDAQIEAEKAELSPEEPEEDVTGEDVASDESTTEAQDAGEETDVDNEQNESTDSENTEPETDKTPMTDNPEQEAEEIIENIEEDSASE